MGYCGVEVEALGVIVDGWLVLTDEFADDRVKAVCAAELTVSLVPSKPRPLPVLTPPTVKTIQRARVPTPRLALKPLAPTQQTHIHRPSAHKIPLQPAQHRQLLPAFGLFLLLYRLLDPCLDRLKRQVYATLKLIRLHCPLQLRIA